MSRRWGDLLHQVGRRGASLIFFALVDLVWAYGLTAAPANPGNEFVAHLLPLPVWAALWAAVGGLCLIYAFRSSDRVAFAAASLLKVAWGTLYLLGWALGEIPRGYLATVIWLAFAGFVQVIAGWMENRGPEWTPPSTSP
jgi:hypothetical protein